MKKIFIALSVLAAVTFWAVPSQALIGVPDAVPGTDVLFPFFLAGITGDENTLMVVTETGKAACTLKYYVYDKESNNRDDDTIILTINDVYSTDAKTLLTAMSTTTKALFEYDLDGDATNDHYLGYITFAEQGGQGHQDHLIGHLYQVDLVNGKASGIIAPAREAASTNGFATDTRSSTVGTIVTNLEAFTADAYTVSKERIAGRAGRGANWFQLSPRYYLKNASAENYLFIWTSSNLGTTFHWNFYDEAEDAHSSTVTLNYELNVLDVRDILPGALQGSYPWAGWIDMSIPDANTGQTFASGWNDTEFLGYSYQIVYGDASESWAALFDVHRDADTDW